jgi:hypothetical protein
VTELHLGGDLEVGFRARAEFVRGVILTVEFRVFAIQRHQMIGIDFLDLEAEIIGFRKSGRNRFAEILQEMNPQLQGFAMPEGESLGGVAVHTSALNKVTHLERIPVFVGFLEAVFHWIVF